MRGSNFFFPADLRNECKKEISAFRRKINKQKAEVREEYEAKVLDAKHIRDSRMIDLDQRLEKERQLIVEKYESLVSERQQEESKPKPQLLHL